MFKDSVNPAGHLVIRKYDASGNLTLEMPVKNLIVNSGKNYIASRMANVSNSDYYGSQVKAMSAIAVGSGTTTPTAADVALQIQLSQVNLTFVPTVNNNTVTFIATYPSGTGTGTWSEAGIFNPDGIMLSRVTFPAVSKLVGDTMTISWVISIV